MKIRTLSIFAGSLACHARCPECIAGMTPRNGVGTKLPEVNWRNFRKACRLAQLGGCTTAMITSKGEPTLFPDQVTKFLEEMQPYDFPIIEMQTNGDLIARGKPVTDDYLKRWHELGLTTVCVSIVSYNAEHNRAVYFPRRKEHFDLPALIAKLHSFGFSVRLSVVLRKGSIDNIEEVDRMIAFAAEHKAEQLTLTPLTKPAAPVDNDIDPVMSKAIYESACRNAISPESFATMHEHIASRGSLLQQLPHGALVYDVKGQNVCVSNCITVDPRSEELRSIIFYPDGHVRYAWQYSGAIIF